MASDSLNGARPVQPEELEGDAVQPGNPLFGMVWINPHRMSGVPCFFGTRVPIKNLFDYVRAGHSLDQFLDDFPGVSRAQVDAVLARAPECFAPRVSGGHAA